MIGLAFLAWTAYQRHDAAVGARTACENAFASATLAEVLRQNEAAALALQSAQNDAEATAKALAELESIHNEALDKLQNPSDSCAIDMHTLERLRNIR
jgi:hypothetical protein